MSSSSLTHLLIRIQGKIETRTRRPWFDLQRTYYYKDARAVKSVQGEWGSGRTGGRGRADGLSVDSPTIRMLCQLQCLHFFSLPTLLTCL